ncbi:hypothetical protein [Glycomyces paridis]|uniref:DUF4878 domain-containing protein n=1 Tax=Glycomyces paridis TaxID=2126555 RepID=A0A4S8PG60_9ACTN|nr:hypothetical protein [Glycomyces paridis]THV27289.1 hypothetical protein E9998_15650 [Glycomyces paridis]
MANPEKASRLAAVKRRLRHPSSRDRFAALVALAVLLPGSIAGYKWQSARAEAGEPVAVVRDFLEASRSGAVEDALALADAVPEGSTDFLTSEAIDGGWSVDSVKLRWIRPSSQTASIRATVTGPEGAQAAWDFDLTEGDDGWKLDDPFSRVWVGTTPFSFVNLNGHRVDLGREPYAEERAELILLPGLYEFHPESADVFESTSGTRLVIGEQVAPVGDAPAGDWQAGPFAVAEGADAVVQSALEAYLDECVAEEEGIWRYGCPFAPNWSESQELERDGVEERVWEIVRYPEITVTIDEWNEPAILAHDAGLARLSYLDASGEELSRIECPIELERLYIGAATDGAMWIGPRDDPDASEEDGMWHHDGFGSLCQSW